jgi:hypothetical protein
MLLSTTITALHNQQRIRYQEWPRNSEAEDNLGRSLWMRITVKEVLANMLPCNHVSTVDCMLHVARVCC